MILPFTQGKRHGHLRQVGCRAVLATGERSGSRFCWSVRRIAKGTGVIGGSRLDERAEKQLRRV